MHLHFSSLSGVDIITLNVGSAENGLESEEGASPRHPFDHNDVKLSVIDQGVRCDPHSPSEVLAVGYCEKIDGTFVENIPVAPNSDMLWLVVE